GSVELVAGCPFGAALCRRRCRGRAQRVHWGAVVGRRAFWVAWVGRACPAGLVVVGWLVRWWGSVAAGFFSGVVRCGMGRLGGGGCGVGRLGGWVASWGRGGWGVGGWVPFWGGVVPSGGGVLGPACWGRGWLGGFWGGAAPNWGIGGGFGAAPGAARWERWLG